MNIVLCGFMGSGKTTVGRALSSLCRLPFFDTDDCVEKACGQSVRQIFDRKGEAFFRDKEHEVCCALANLNGAVIAAGGGTLTYARNCKAFAEKCVIVFLDASFDVICRRIPDASSRPLFKNKENAKALYDSRRALYEKAAGLTVNADRPAEEVAAAVYKAVFKAEPSCSE